MMQRSKNILAKSREILGFFNEDEKEIARLLQEHPIKSDEDIIAKLVEGKTYLDSKKEQAPASETYEQNDALQPNNNYQYEDYDIQAILTARLKELADTTKPIYSLAAVDNLGTDQLKQRLLADKQEYQGKPQKRIILIPVNLGLYHWVGILLELDLQGNAIRAEYFESLTGAKITPHWQQQIEGVYGCKLQQRSLLIQEDHTSCGAYTIENLLLSAQNLPAPKDLTNLAMRKKHLICLEQNDPEFYQRFFERQKSNQVSVADLTTQLALHKIAESFSSDQIQRVLQIKRWIQQINNKEAQQHLLDAFKFQAEDSQDQSHRVHLNKIRQSLKQAAVILQDPEDKKLLIAMVEQLFGVNWQAEQKEIGKMLEILERSDFRLQYAEISAIGLERELSFGGEGRRFGGDNVAVGLQAKQNTTAKIDKSKDPQEAKAARKIVSSFSMPDQYTNVLLQADTLFAQEPKVYHHYGNAMDDLLFRKEQEKFQQQQKEKIEQNKKRIEALKQCSKEEHEMVYSNKSKNKLWNLDPTVYRSKKLDILYIQEVTSEPDLETIQKEHNDKMPLLIKHNSKFYICDYYTGDKICMMLASHTQAKLYNYLSFPLEVRQLSNSTIAEYLQHELYMIDCPKDEDKFKFVEQLIKRMKEALHQGLPIIDCPRGGDDFKFVEQLIKRRPIPYYKVSKVKIINNYNFAQEFEFCAQRHAKRKVKETSDVQQAALNRLNFFTYTDEEYKDAKIFVGFRAMDKGKFLRVMHSGFAKEATKDKQSFYSKGIYLASDIELSKRNYGGGYNGTKPLTVCWAHFGNPYIIENLKEAKSHSGKANKDDHDAHYIPTKPINFKLHEHLQEKSYIPAANDLENAVTDELVVFEESQCLPRYLIEIEREIPELNSVEELIDFASTVTANETVACTFLGRKIENQLRKDLYIKALEENKTSLNPIALISLSEIVEPSEDIKIFGSKTNIKKLLHKCLKQNKNNASIFNAIGQHTATDEEIMALGIDGCQKNADCFIKAIELNLQSTECLKAEYYLNLAKTMRAGQEVTILDYKRNKQQLLQTCLQLNPHMSEAYVELGHVLLGEQPTTILSETGELLEVSKKELYRKAIYYDKDYAAAYRYLASVVGEEKVNVDHMTDEKINAKQLLIKACEKDPKDAENFAALSLCLMDNEIIEVKIDGEKERKDKKSWALHAYKLNPKNANIWFALAECLSTKSDVIIELEVESRLLRNKSEFLQQAIKYEPEHAPSLVALAELENIASNKEKGEEYLCRAISANKNYKKAYIELVKLGGTGKQPFLLNGEKLFMQDFLVQTIKYHPSEEDLWFALGNFFYSSAKEKITITIHEEKYDYAQCYRKALHLAKEKGKKDKENKFLEYIEGRPDLNTLLIRLENISLEEIADDEQLKQGLDLYVDTNVAVFFKDEYQQEDLFSTDSVVNAFIKNLELQILLLEGHAGTSKTLYCRHLEKRLWRELWKEKDLSQSIIPLFVPLGLFGGDLAKPKQQDLIERILLKKRFTSEQIEILKGNKFLFILDGFDEISLRLRDNERCRINDAIYYHNWQGKTIVTSRPGMMNDRALDKCKVEKRFITSFLTTQVEDYLLKYVSSEYNQLDWSITRYKEELSKFSEIQEMIKEPLLLKLILQILPNLDDLIQQGKMQRPLTRLIIYRECAQRWIIAEITKRKNVDDSDFSGSDSESSSNIAQQIKKYLMGLAIEMLSIGETSIDENCDAGQGINYKPGRTLIDKQGFKSGLIKRNENTYHFTHNSFRDYFASQKMLEEFSGDKSIEQSAWINHIILRDEYNVLRFMADVLQMKLRKEYKKKLFDIIEETKTQDGRNWEIAASNAFSILNAGKIAFSGMNFRGIKAPYANLDGSLCYAINFSGADLSKCNLAHSNIAKANFENANLSEVNLKANPYLMEHSPETSIECISYSPKGNVLASATEDGNVFLKDLNSDGLTYLCCSEEERVFFACSDVVSLLFNREFSKFVIVATKKNFERCFIAIWNIGCDRNTKLIISKKTIYENDFPISNNCNYTNALLSSFDGVVLAYDGSLIISDIDTTEATPHKICKDPSSYITAMCNYDGAKLLVGCNYGKIYIVNTTKKNTTYEEIKCWKGHEKSITALSYREGAKYFASATIDEEIVIWGCNYKKIKCITGHMGKVDKMVFFNFNHAEVLLTSSIDDQILCLWDPLNGVGRALESADIKSFAVSPQGELFYGGRNGTVYNANFNQTEPLQLLNGHFFPITNFYYNQETERFITIGAKELKVWDFDFQTLLINKRLEEVIIVATLLRDKIFLATRNNLLCFRLETCDYDEYLNFSKEEITLLEPSKDEKSLLICNKNNLLVFLDIETKEIYSQMQLEQNAECLLFLGDNRFIAGNWDRTISFWNKGEIYKKFKGHRGSITCLVLLGNNTLISGSLDCSIRKWNIDNGACQELLRHTAGVNLVITKDADTIFSGSLDGEIRIWNTTNNSSNIVGQHKGKVSGMLWMRDSLISTSIDKTIRFWKEHGDNDNWLQINQIAGINLELDGRDAIIQKCKIAEEKKIILRQRGALDESDLIYAYARNGNSRKLEKLLSQDRTIDLDAPQIRPGLSLRIQALQLSTQHGRNGLTPLINGVKSGCLKVVILLVEKGANVNLATADTGKTPLMVAVEFGFEEIAKFLILQGAELDAQTIDGKYTALRIACLKGFFSLAELLVNEKNINFEYAPKTLVEYKKDLKNSKEQREQIKGPPFHKNEELYNPKIEELGDEIKNYESSAGICIFNNLMTAACYGYADIVNLLIEKGAEITIINGTHNALTLASFAGWVDVVKVLISKVDVNFTTKGGQTVLMAACISGYYEIAVILLDNGAKVNQEDDQGATALMCAVQKGYLNIVQLLINKGAVINKACQNKDNPGCTVLIFACSNGNYEVAELLIANGADVNQGDDQGVTALMCAVQQGYLNIVQLLINNDAVIDQACQNKGHTALTYACLYGKYEIAEFLIEKTVDVNQGNNITALMGAASQGYLDIVQLLINKGAVINKACQIKDNPGCTALMFACLNGKYEMAEFLIANKIDVNQGDNVTALMCAAQEDHLNIAKLLITHGAEIDKASRNTGETALTYACFNGNHEMAELLITNKANVNQEDVQGFTVLMGAAQKGYLNIVQLLITHGAAINKACQDNGRTALMYACFNGKYEIAEILLTNTNKANVDQEDFQGFTALIGAAQKGYLNIVQLLINHDAVINKARINKASQDGGETALMCACLSGKNKVAEFLIANQADVNQKDDQGFTALMCAAQEGYLEIVQLLINHGAIINQAKNNGWTVLMSATLNNHCVVAELLLKCGADIELECIDEDGGFALMAAVRKELFEMAQLLIEHGANINKIEKESGYTVIMEAAKKGSISMLELLIENKAQLCFMADDGKTTFKILLENGHKEASYLLANKMLARESIEQNRIINYLYTKHKQARTIERPYRNLASFRLRPP